MSRLITISLLFFSLTAKSTEIYIDTIYDGPTNTKVIISIDGCETVFNVKTTELDKLSSSSEDLDTMVRTAKERTKNGCKN